MEQRRSAEGNQQSATSESLAHLNSHSRGGAAAETTQRIALVHPSGRAQILVGAGDFQLAMDLARCGWWA